MVLYTGTFEAYQGLDLLFDGDGARPRARGPTRGSCWPAAGPIRSQRARAAGARAPVSATRRSSPASGRPRRFPRYLDAADVLVSPRSTGTNTPLKIYQYLRSGRPIVATRLLTHTQVLDDDVAILTDADAGGFAGGDPRGARRSASARARSATRARQLAETKYSYEAYLTRTRAGLRAPDRRRATPQVAGGVA